MNERRVSTFIIRRNIMRLQNDINIILGVIKAQDTLQHFCDSPAGKKIH